MGRTVARLIGVGTVLGAMLGVTGCGGSSVGDPCTPEEVPEGGFEPAESFLETSSVQCRTRTCLVFRLNGDPSKVIGTPSCPEGDSNCVNEEEKRNRVQCTCRCDAPEGDQGGGGLCDCPSTHGCFELIQLASAPGLSGSYCVSCDALCDSFASPDGIDLSEELQERCGCGTGSAPSPDGGMSGG